MSDIAVKAENIGKLYRIGEFVGYTTLRESLTNAVLSPFRALRSGRRNRSEKESIWALKDVSFEVERGEVVGIIGRNGAGKSTLLKVLARITEPTEGYVEVRGRVSSLLEVGTGFHPELTGKENIYLNGAILGMKKREIDSKFDEIVNFSGVEKFINTPLKRYSSGMQVRLAFAVAAHLEPEVLLVDEVLAVGDAEFQKKSLGKMNEIARSGRTVLFVSHNIPTVKRLCQSAYLLEQGKIIDSGDALSVSESYYKFISGDSRDSTKEREVPQGTAGFVSWQLHESETGEFHQCFTRQKCTFRFTLRNRRDIPQANFGFAIWSSDGSLIWAMRNLDYGGECIALKEGSYEIEFSIPALPVKPGTYQIHASVNDLSEGVLDSWYGYPDLTVLPRDESGIPPNWQGVLDVKGEFNIYPVG